MELICFGLWHPQQKSIVSDKKNDVSFIGKKSRTLLFLDERSVTSVSEFQIDNRHLKVSRSRGDTTRVRQSLLPVQTACRQNRLNYSKWLTDDVY